MGYTHHWQCAPNLPAGPFKAAVSDCRKALARTGIPLAGPIGLGSPVFRCDAIAFNGPDKTGVETFQIDRNAASRNRQEWYFCDGGDADWAAARQFCQEYLGYGEDFVLTRG